jgi:uncharacterized membrane protein YqjE
MWWSLSKAAPILFRHLAAYAELAGQDLALARRDTARRLLASVLVITCGVFAVLMACLAVVAATWDTPNRLSAIGWMCGVFLALASAFALLRSRLIRDQPPVFSSLRSEWQADREILDRLLAETED